MPLVRCELVRDAPVNNQDQVIAHVEPSKLGTHCHAQISPRIFTVTGNAAIAPIHISTCLTNLGQAILTIITHAEGCMPAC